VAGDVREGRERSHRVVDVFLAEVAQYKLGVRPTDSRESRSNDDPVGPEWVRIVYLVQTKRKTVETLVELVSWLRTRPFLWRLGPKDERFQISSPLDPQMTRSLSTSATLHFACSDSAR
jgi:hypothetical protein